MHIAIVILNYNTQNFLEKFLPSVIQTSYLNKSIVVVDNASTDNSVAYVKTNFPEVRLIEFTENYGFTGGYNKALQQVEADYFVLLNSDVLVNSDWLEPMVEMATNNPKIAAIQPKILQYSNAEYFEYAGASGGFMDKWGFPFCRGRIFDNLEKDNAQYDAPMQVFWSTGAALFIKSDVYKQCGGLEESFFAHMEEIDLCWRIQNAGYQVWVCPQSVVYHVGGGTLQKENPRKTFYNFRNGLWLLIRNLPKNKLYSTLFIRILLDWIAALHFTLKGNWSSAGAILKAHYAVLITFNKVKKMRSNMSNNAFNTTLIYPKSIVWQYFINKNNKFSSLKHKF